jgi:hypothetical protein
MGSASPPRSFFERVRRTLETAELVTVLTALFDVGRDPGDPDPPRDVIAALTADLSPTQAREIEWIYGIVRGAEMLEGLGMLRGLMGGGRTYLRHREPVDVTPVIERHVVDLLTFRAALANSVGVGPGENLRRRLVDEIEQAIESKGSDVFGDDLDALVREVIAMDLGEGARETRNREKQRVADEARSADPGRQRRGYFRVALSSPNPYVLRIDNMLDVLGVHFEKRDAALNAAQDAFEGAKRSLALET